MNPMGVMSEPTIRNSELTSSAGMQREDGTNEKSSFSSIMNLLQSKPVTRYESAQTKEISNLTSTNQRVDVKESSKNTTEPKKEIDEYTKELKEKLKDLLKKSDKEVEDLLEKLGLSMSDLFSPENLTAFILESFDASTIEEALSNEELSSALLDASKLLTEVVEELDFDSISEMKGSKTGEDVKEEFNTSLIQKEDSANEKEVQVEVRKEGSDAKHEGSSRGNGPENFVDVLAAKADLSSIQTESSALYESKQIVSQLIDQIRLNVSQTKTSMELVLNPESLGKIQVMVQSKSGVLTAHLNCENEITKEALESSLQQLKESFEEQGIKVEKVEVTIGNYTSEYAEQEDQAKEQEKSNSNKKIKIDDYLGDEVENEETNSHIPVNTLNGTIEYMA